MLQLQFFSNIVDERTIIGPTRCRSNFPLISEDQPPVIWLFERLSDSHRKFDVLPSSKAITKSHKRWVVNVTSNLQSVKVRGLLAVNEIAYVMNHCIRASRLSSIKKLLKLSSVTVRRSVLCTQYDNLNDLNEMSFISFSVCFVNYLCLHHSFDDFNDLSLVACQCEGLVDNLCLFIFSTQFYFINHSFLQLSSHHGI